MRNPFRRSCPPEVHVGLCQLLRDPALQEAREVVNSALFYADIGRDRRKLTMDWVDDTRKRALDHLKFKEGMVAMFADLERQWSK